MTRAEAKAAGLTRYFNGKPCPKGHLAERHVSSGSCVICLEERSLYRDRTTDKERAGSRRRNARYLERHREEERERLKRWRDSHRESIAFRTANRRAARYGARGIMTASLVLRTFRRQNGRCNICGTDISDFYILDHKLALGLGGSNVPSNIQLLCPKCDLPKTVADRHAIRLKKR